VADELAAAIDAIRRRAPEVVGRVVRVLVVEDNQHVARFIRDGLVGSKIRDVEFEFTWSEDGRAALTALDDGAYDAAIVDMYLPEVDGPEVISRIRRHRRLSTMPIIAVSAGGAPARTAALDAGADLFLDKPMRLRQIVESMVELVGLRAG
jgi:DNA-binding response OmpR family regulator